jgi:hypothetical protein
MSFSEETGPFRVVLFIELISTAKGRGIDKEAAALPSTVFLFGIRDRG